MAQMVENLPAMQETCLWSQNRHPLEKGMATHSSILAWRIPWTEEPGRLQCMGWQRAGHDWVTFTFQDWELSVYGLQKREIEVCRVWGMWAVWFKMPASRGYRWSPRGGWDCQGERPCWKAERDARGGALRSTSIWSPEEDKELRGRKRRLRSVVEASVLCSTFLVYTQMFADGLIVSPHEQGLLCFLAHKCILNA